MDGRIICNHIKKGKRHGGLTVILIFASYYLAESLCQKGAPNDYIAKPFYIARLIQKVEPQLAA